MRTTVPVAEALALLARLRARHGTIQGVARAYADRFGCSVATAARRFSRIRHQQHVSDRLVDELEVLLWS